MTEHQPIPAYQVRFPMRLDGSTCEYVSGSYINPDYAKTLDRRIAARQVNAATSTCAKCGQAVTDCSTNDGPCWHTDNGDDPFCPVHDGVGDERWFHEAEKASGQ